VENWAEIRRLHRGEGLPIKAIARRLWISRNTVKRAMATDRLPPYSRPAVATSFTPVVPLVRELLRDIPWPALSFRSGLIGSHLDLVRVQVSAY
jgi:hypothetical protein